MTFLDVAISAAKKGGAIIARYFETGIAREEKDDTSFVTIADKEAEAAIIKEIRNHFPAHGFLGEESGATDLLHAQPNRSRVDHRPERPEIRGVCPCGLTRPFGEHVEGDWGRHDGGGGISSRRNQV